MRFALRHQLVDDAHHLAVGLLHAAQVPQGVLQGLAIVGGQRGPGLVVHGGVRCLDLPERALAVATILGVVPLAEAAGVLIRQLRRVSRPGRRVYSAVKDLPRVYNGLGIAILSTPRGVMSDAEAREAHVGGEVLCTVF